MLCFTIYDIVQRVLGLGGSPLQQRKEWSVLWPLPRLLTGEMVPTLRSGGHEMTAGNPAHSDSIQKHTAMSRGQPEGPLWRTEDFTGAKAKAAAFATT